MPGCSELWLCVGLRSADGRHGLTAEVLVRALSDAKHHASPAVVRQLGQQLKPALAYSYRVNRLDDPAYPMRGWACRCAGGAP